MDHEVACISATRHGAESDVAEFIAVGLWTDNTIRVLHAADLSPVQTVCLLLRSSNLRPTPRQVKLAADTIPRSLVSVVMDGVAYVLCALGDGVLFTFTQDGSGLPHAPNAATDPWQACCQTNARWCWAPGRWN